MAPHHGTSLFAEQHLVTVDVLLSRPPVADQLPLRRREQALNAHNTDRQTPQAFVKRDDDAADSAAKPINVTVFDQGICINVCNTCWGDPNRRLFRYFRNCVAT
jgi:hypothetical protein